MAMTLTLALARGPEPLDQAVDELLGLGLLRPRPAGGRGEAASLLVVVHPDLLHAVEVPAHAELHRRPLQRVGEGGLQGLPLAHVLLGHPEHGEAALDRVDVLLAGEELVGVVPALGADGLVEAIEHRPSVHVGDHHRAALVLGDGLDPPVDLLLGEGLGEPQPDGFVHDPSLH